MSAISGTIVIPIFCRTDLHSPQVCIPFPKFCVHNKIPPAERSCFYVQSSTSVDGAVSVDRPLRFCGNNYRTRLLQCPWSCRIWCVVSWCCGCTPECGTFLFVIKGSLCCTSVNKNLLASLVSAQGFFYSIGFHHFIWGPLSQIFSSRR